MGNEEEPEKSSGPGPNGSDAGAERRRMRLEELRRDLFHAPPVVVTAQGRQGRRSGVPAGDPQATYALEMLLAMLWVETGTARLGVACALADAPLQSGKSEAPPFAARLCARLEAPDTNPNATAPASLTTPRFAPLRAWAEVTVTAIFTDALNTCQSRLRPGSAADVRTLERETEVCHAALRLAPHVSTPALTAACLRVLRVFPDALARATPPLGLLAAALREHACIRLAALPPEELRAFWSALGASDPSESYNLLYLLDFVQDTRAVPPLLALLERPAVARDNDRIALAVVRALHRLLDRRALPVLRRFLKDREREGEKRREGEEGKGEEERGDAGADDREATNDKQQAINNTPDTTRELLREARRALHDIEHNQATPEKRFLLRPALRAVSDLLRPLGRPPDEDGRADLLRSEAQEEE